LRLLVAVVADAGAETGAEAGTETGAEAGDETAAEAETNGGEDGSGKAKAVLGIPNAGAAAASLPVAM
jgi:hypothetical protein